MAIPRRVSDLAMIAGLALPLPWQPAAAQHPGAEMKPVAPFDAVSLEASRTIRLRGSPEEVFPLFDPEGRQRWSSFSPVILKRPALGWEGAVYLQATVHEDPNTGVVVHFDPLRRSIRYLTIIPGSEAWEMEVRVGPMEGGSYATVTYRVTSLSFESNPEITEFFEGHFEGAIDSWAAAIDRYLGH